MTSQSHVTIVTKMVTIKHIKAISNDKNKQGTAFRNENYVQHEKKYINRNKNNNNKWNMFDIGKC